MNCGRLRSTPAGMPSIQRSSKAWTTFEGCIHLRPLSNWTKYGSTSRTTPRTTSRSKCLHRSRLFSTFSAHALMPRRIILISTYSYLCVRTFPTCVCLCGRCVTVADITTHISRVTTGSHTLFPVCFGCFPDICVIPFIDLYTPRFNSNFPTPVIKLFLCPRNLDRALNSPR